MGWGDELKVIGTRMGFSLLTIQHIFSPERTVGVLSL
jgi:hypothetical protein